MSSFTKRIYGSAIIKAVNSNFNADFTSTPRTLPDGVVYATDKALKYAIKDYLRKQNKGTMFYIQRNDETDLKPLTLDKTYRHLFGQNNQTNRVSVLKNLLSCLDIRLFGATFAGQTGNVSIHGPVQINHAINRFPENAIYSEQIKAPFAGSDGADMTTIGNQTNLKEGHYVYHLSVNPQNLLEYARIANNEGITEEDIALLKKALCHSVTALDTSRKMGCENEALIWVVMKEGSSKHLPSFTDLIEIKRQEGSRRTIDLTMLTQVLKAVTDEIESVELWYNPVMTDIVGLDSATQYNIHSHEKIS